MSKQQEALRLALEALEAYGTKHAHTYGLDGAWDEEITRGTLAVMSIREALADSALDRMAENARELGLDYEPIVEQVEDFVGMGHKAWDMVDPKELAKGFHEALAEPPCKTGSQCTNKCQQCEQPAQQQEPVAKPYAYEYGRDNGDGTYSVVIEKGDLVQTSPAVYNYVRPRNAHKDWPIKELFDRPPASQRSVKPWEGLTEGEINEFFEGMEPNNGFWLSFARAIEAKLKEKNT